jgi:hypothetical protein
MQHVSRGQLDISATSGMFQNLHPHQKTNDLATTVQGFQSVNIQAEEIKTSLLGAQVAGK